MKSVVGVIPARFSSTRFPGKPLALIAGREMISWVIEGARTAKLLDEVWVATDDERIAEVAVRENARVAMTDPELPSGTDRVWEAIRKVDCEIVINIQGDEPLVQGSLVDALIQPLLDQKNLEMTTLAHPLSHEDLPSINSVKVVTDQWGQALYFSRFAIPYSRGSPDPSSFSVAGALKHIGMYGYRKNFLEKFCASPQAKIEKAESLEQLRALYLGAKIKVIQVNERSLGVDTPEDVKKVEEILARKKSNESKSKS